MRSACLVGFPQEQGIRLAAALAGRGVFAEPASRVPTAADVDLALVDGTARPHLLCALQRWGGRNPPYAVGLVYPLDALPLDGASLFPPWVKLVTKTGLDRYLHDDLQWDLDGGRHPAPRTVGYRDADGLAGIVQVDVLGPSGVIFETARAVQRHAAVTFFIPIGRRTPLTMPGTVVSRRPRWLGQSRCVASFMAATAPQRRALGCLLAGFS